MSSNNNNNNKILNFKLDAETIKKLMKTKNVNLDVKKNEPLELVLTDTRIKLDTKSPKSTATYYNNKSSNLFFYGDTIEANATVEKIVPTSSSSEVVPIEKKQRTSAKKKSAATREIDTLLKSNNNNNNNNIKTSSLLKKSTTAAAASTKKSKSTPIPNNIPSSRGSVTPQSNTTTTPRPSSQQPVEKLNDRVVQLLALRPFQVSTLAKLLDCTQWDIKKILDDVAILIPDPQKKKYCLKPNSYRNIRIWDWPLYTNEEKITVCANAREAFDIIKLASDAPERYNLIDPSSSKVAAKKPSNSRKLSPKASPTKGSKTTPLGFSSFSTPTPPEPNSKMKPPSSSSSQRQSPLSQQQLPHLKPSSSNKKVVVGSKALPIEKLSPPTKRKSDQVESQAVPPPPSIPTQQPHAPTSSKRMKSMNLPPLPIELSQLKTQSMFDKYCVKFVSSQKEYQNTKTNFKSKFPHYIKSLKNIKPPTGSKRSYFDSKLEYYDLVKDNYLKYQDESSWEEAENQLRDCNEKRTRLNYMWSSIEKNMNDHDYKLNYKM